MHLITNLNSIDLNLYNFSLKQFVAVSLQNERDLWRMCMKFFAPRRRPPLIPYDDLMMMMMDDDIGRIIVFSCIS